MKRRNAISAVAAAVLATGLIVTLIATSRPSSEDTITVGGFRVSIFGVASPGKPFTTEKKWHSWARKILPGRFERWIPQSTTFNASGWSQSAIIVVLKATPIDGTPATNSPWAGYRSESLDGEELEVQRQRKSRFKAPPAADLVMDLPVGSFPRRDPAFNLRLLADDGSSVGVLRVPNPIAGPFPVWTARPLPQTATNGNVALTIKSVKSGSTYRPGQRTDGLTFWNFRASGLSPEYELSSDPLWKGARLVSFVADDATGNRPGPLPRTEPAWRIKATISRTDPSAFLPEEKLVLTSMAPTNALVAGVAIRIPDQQKPMTPTGSRKDNGRTEGFTGKFEELRQPAFTIETDLDPDAPGVTLSCIAFDLSGNPIARPTYPTPGGLVRGKRSFDFVFPIAPGGPRNWSRIEIFVSHAKTFEFFINPADVKTNTVTK